MGYYIQIEFGPENDADPIHREVPIEVMDQYLDASDEDPHQFTKTHPEDEDDPESDLLPSLGSEIIDEWLTDTEEHPVENWKFVKPPQLYALMDAWTE